MRQKIETGTFVLAAAMLLAVGLPATAQEIRDVDTDSPVVDILMSDGMTREEMVGLYEALAVGDFEPPECVPGEEMFDDVPAASLFCSWIEEPNQVPPTFWVDGAPNAGNAVILTRSSVGIENTL